MKLFEPQTNLKSYISSIIKIIIGVVLIVLLICRKSFTYRWANAIAAIFAFVLCCTAILIIYVSVAELFFTHSNRQKTNRSSMCPSKSKYFDVEFIFNLTKENDIVEIKIYMNESVIEIGASSDCENGSNRFFDKRYYIGQEEYFVYSDFCEALRRKFPNGEICVLTIDGIFPR